jgi:5-oxopent-3-ene-1,2,5-tricarboxylate decarboxylase/2-hydroxyhepta-2,4-diene-1,7-dioate isomerase
MRRAVDQCVTLRIKRGINVANMASACSCHEDLSIASVSCPDDVLTRLQKVSIATLFQILNRLGFQHTYLAGVSPRTQAQRFVGRAFTMRCLPAREDVMRAQTPATSLHRRAFETINPGQVLVIDARGELSAGVLGDVLATRLVARGGVTVVTDGAVRDLPAMQEVGLPLFARGVHTASFGRVHIVADLNIPMQCAGVLIMPGDVLVGDPEGVVAIPQAVAAQAAEAGLEQELRDTFSRTKVAAGASLSEAFPPNERLRAEYEAWRQQQGI